MLFSGGLPQRWPPLLPVQALEALRLEDDAVGADGPYMGCVEERPSTGPEGPEQHGRRAWPVALAPGSLPLFLDLPDMQCQPLPAACMQAGLSGPRTTGPATHPNVYGCLPEPFV